jgi:hypothetical protein
LFLLFVLSRKAARTGKNQTMIFKYDCLAAVDEECPEQTVATEFVDVELLHILAAIFIYIEF